MPSNTQVHAKFGESIHVWVILPGIEDFELVVDFEVEIFIEKALKVQYWIFKEFLNSKTITKFEVATNRFILNNDIRNKILDRSLNGWLKDF